MVLPAEADESHVAAGREAVRAAREGARALLGVGGMGGAGARGAGRLPVPLGSGAWLAGR